MRSVKHRLHFGFPACGCWPYAYFGGAGIGSDVGLRCCAVLRHGCHLNANANAKTSLAAGVVKQFRIIGAMLMRETTTRFGREQLGFLWVIGEPLMFCMGVITLWHFLRGPYEHGIRLAPFCMTGYMCLILLRHMIGMSMGAIQANSGLMHHRQVTVIHIFIARNLVEYLGSTSAFIVVYVVLLAMHQVDLPHNYLLAYAGWITQGWISFTLAIMFAAFALKIEVLERVVSLLTYAMIPLSGAFTMAAWVPANYRHIYLSVPMPHGVEMLRAGVFGDNIPTYYTAWYPWACGAIFLLIALIMLANSKEQILGD